MASGTTQTKITTIRHPLEQPNLSGRLTVDRGQILARGSNISSLTREILIHEPGEKVWAILADIGSVQEYSPGVIKSYYTSEIRVGIGASRHCDLYPNGTVEERIVDWHDRKQYSIEIYDWAEVPYTGVAHFKLKRIVEGTIVIQTMDFRPAKDSITNASGNRPIEELVARVIEGNLSGLKHFIETGETVTYEVFRRIKESTGGIKR